jgi:putative FmdB family regulatory protein
VPVYEFVCMGCEHRFDRLLPMSEASPACPSCGREDTRRQLSMFAAARREGGGSSGGCACGGACACSR